MRKYVCFVLAILLVSSFALAQGGPGRKSAPDGQSAPSDDPWNAPSSANKVMHTDMETTESFVARGPTVLLFVSNTGRQSLATLRDINDHGNLVPNDVTIVVVDMDRHPELRTRYGVKVSNTFVQIDGKGQALTRWSGGGANGVSKHVRRSTIKARGPQGVSGPQGGDSEASRPGQNPGDGREAD